ncbi:MAG: heparinase II/III family protein [Pseudomonadota bacterium]
MSLPIGNSRPKGRTPEEDAALWRRFRGTLGESARPSATQWLKVITTPSPAFDWSRFNHLGPHDPQRGAALARGIWRAGTERFEASGEELPWDFTQASLHFKDRMHRFDWLVHLSAEGPQGAEKAIDLVDAWIETHGKFDGFSWRAGPCADRVWNWMRCGRLLFGSVESESPEAKTRIGVLRRQVSHLEALAGSTADIDARFRAAMILTVLAALESDGGRLRASLELLESECTAQILPDGGHVSRSPERLLRAMLDLASVGSTLRLSGHPEPEFLSKWMPRMGAMLNFFRCDDGALYPFNDGAEASPEDIDAALDSLETPPRRFTFSPKSGFQKLERGDLRLVLDVGRAPDQPFGDMAHAGALGFELSDGPARIVTSCGYSREVNVDLQAAVRRSGAHSTLVLAGRDNSSFTVNESSRLLSPNGPEGISAKRLEEDHEIWLDAQHSGYKQTFGLLHRRRLFMAGDGKRLTGEDSLVRPVSREHVDDDRPIGFEIRFHLHPTVTALMGRGAILLECENGARWRFKTSHPGARLERSLYFARNTLEHPDQIVISGRADPNSDGSEPPNCVRWAFLRDTGSP